MNTSYSYDPHIWPALLTVGSAVVLGLYSWHHRKIPAAIPFAIGCLFAALWAMGAAMEVSADTFFNQVFWAKFQVVWQLPTTTAFPVFVLVYAGLGRWLTRRNLALLTIFPLLFVVLVITNDFHHLIWTDFKFDHYVIPSQGMLNPIFLAYGYLLGLVNIIVLIWLAARFPRHRVPSLIMLSGVIVSYIVFLIDYVYAGLIGPGEFVLVTMGATSSMYGLAFFRFHIINPVPAARIAAIEQMDDGMLVLDLEGKIVDLNPAAAKIFGGLRPGLLGRAVNEVFPVNRDLLAMDKEGTLQSEISLKNGKGTRDYNLYLTLLKDKRHNPLGRLLVFHEVTEQKRVQAEFIKQQRVVATLQERERLARELHDSSGQVLGYVNLQAQAIQKWLQNGNIEKALASLARLAEVAMDAHIDVRESILGLKTGPVQEWAFLPALKRYLDDFQSQYGLYIELLISEELKENGLDAASGIQLLRVIQEALTNTRKHSGARSVWISFERVDSRVFIHIVDDGSGFDISQRDRETCGHFGLVFMQERMEQIGGSVKIDSRPGAGTIVILELPLREQTEETG
jgi:PAS domain S-box-containing protein